MNQLTETLGVALLSICVGTVGLAQFGKIKMPSTATAPTATVQTARAPAPTPVLVVVAPAPVEEAPAIRASRSSR